MFDYDQELTASVPSYTLQIVLERYAKHKTPCTVFWQESL